MRAIRRRISCLAVALIAVTPSIGSAQQWTTWNASDATSVSGMLAGFGVFYNGIFNAAQLSGTGFDYFNFAPGAYTQGGLTAPTNSGFIQFIGPSTGTITFSVPVLNPYISFISVGQTGVPITYDFGSAAFSVLSNNNVQCAFWGCGSYTTSGNTLTGREFSGTIQFLGTYSSLSLTTTPTENWHGITVGAPVTATPEPATLGLVGTGLVGLFGFGRRRRAKA